jgi:hypothetical protein
MAKVLFTEPTRKRLPCPACARLFQARWGPHIGWYFPHRHREVDPSKLHAERDWCPGSAQFPDHPDPK